jgi:repressor LexA
MLDGTNVLKYICFMETSSDDNLTQAQNELYGWIKNYMKEFQHSPSIRQMMQAMGLKSPAPIQSRLKHLQEKGYISWQEGKARTMQIVDEIIEGVPIMGSIAAGGLIETFSDVSENLDLSEVLKKKDVFALTVNGDSMIDACIAHGDMVLMEPIKDFNSLRNGAIVSATVPGLGSTLKYFFRREGKIFLEAANPAYEPIVLNPDQAIFQGKLLAVWRQI